MKLLLAHARATALELIRYPAYSIPTLVFPATLYLVAAGRAEDGREARLLGFAAIAVLGVAFFQFGVGIANDRTRQWERYLRTLPVSPAVRIGARVLCALAFAGLSAAAVVLAGAGRGATIPLARAPAVAAALLLGAVPFAFLGIALGYAVRPRAALPLANLLYLPLAYTGGLWSGPRASPDVPSLLPTRAWAEVLWAASGSAAFAAAPVLSLAGWTAVAFTAASWCYRHDEGERFR